MNISLTSGGEHDATVLWDLGKLVLTDLYRELSACGWCDFHL